MRQTGRCTRAPDQVRFDEDEGDRSKHQTRRAPESEEEDTGAPEPSERCAEVGHWCPGPSEYSFLFKLQSEIMYIAVVLQTALIQLGPVWVSCQQCVILEPEREYSSPGLQQRDLGAKRILRKSLFQDNRRAAVQGILVLEISPG